MNNKIKIYVVAGPTSSGKSDRAIELALTVDGEVVSADSRQIYRGLDVGTGKISIDEMKNVTHHCLSIKNPKQQGENLFQNFSVHDWLSYARVAIDDIISRGKVPIVCGGTGFYIDALIYGLPDNGPINIKLREELERLDIATLEKRYNVNILNIKNKRRLIRAIEIKESGVEIKERNRNTIYDIEWIMMDINKETLIKNIRSRCIKRLDAMISETKNLLSINIDKEWLSSVGIEYKQIILFLENSNKTNSKESIFILREELIESIVTKSWQYAKRQMTWNKKYISSIKFPAYGKVGPYTRGDLNKM